MICGAKAGLNEKAGRLKIQYFRIKSKKITNTEVLKAYLASMISKACRLVGLCVGES